MDMRNYTITKKSGELHNCEVTDSNGKIYQNYFDTEQELLSKAILNCKEIDKNNNNLRSIL